MTKSFEHSELNLQNFYTNPAEAGQLLLERWENEQLRRAVEKQYGEKIPKEILSAPHGVMWRQICSPDREFDRYLKLLHEANLKPLGLETVDDKFVSGNFTKLGLTNLPFATGQSKSGNTIAEKVKIIDFNSWGGKRLSDIKTLWGESLVDFHHSFLITMYPEMEGNIVDIYEWTKSHGIKPEEYYPAVLAFALAHYVLFDDYDLLAAEDDFTLTAVLPAFKLIEKEYGLRPLIVKLSEPGEHERDQYWWAYTEEARAIMEQHKNVWT